MKDHANDEKRGKLNNFDETIGIHRIYEIVECNMWTSSVYL